MAINQKEIDLAYRCADLYHNHDASEFEISQKLDISRPKVSRLLALARDLGIITISIKPPELFNQIELERSLTAQYHLQNVLIGIPKDNTDASIQSAIASRFLEAFQNLLKPDIRIGIGVGSTIYATSRMLRLNGPVPPRISLFPLMGLAGRTDPAYQVNNIIDLFAEPLGANRNYLMAPAIFENTVQKDVFYKSQQVFEIVSMWEKLDVAVFGIGGPIERSAILFSSFPEKYLVQFVQSHAVGDILAHFFDLEGKLVCPEAEAVLLSISFSALKAIPQRISLAGGLWKLNSIKTALRSNLITILVTDLLTAQNLVE